LIGPWFYVASFFLKISGYVSIQNMWWQFPPQMTLISEDTGHKFTCSVIVALSSGKWV